MRKAEKALSNGGLISKILNKLTKVSNDVDKINSDLTPIKLESPSISIGGGETKGIIFSIPNDKTIVGISGLHGGNSRMAITAILPSEDLKSVEMWIVNTNTSNTYDIAPSIYITVR